MYNKELCVTNLSNSMDNIIKNGFKEYEFFHNKVAISHIDVDTSINPIPYLTYIKSINKYDLWIFTINDIKLNLTYVYYITPYMVKNKNYNKILSIETDIIPSIREIYKLKNKFLNIDIEEVLRMKYEDKLLLIELLGYAKEKISKEIFK